MIRFAKKRFFSGVAAAFVVCAAVSSAPVQAQEISESHLNAAKEAVMGAQVLSSFDDILPMVAEQTKSLFIRSNPAATVQIDLATTEVALEMAEKRPELNKIIYEVWARRFTEDELKQIAAFYDSPVGKKLADMGPELTAFSVGAAKQWGDKLSTDMLPLVDAKLKEAGVIE